METTNSIWAEYIADKKALESQGTEETRSKADTRPNITNESGGQIALDLKPDA